MKQKVYNSSATLMGVNTIEGHYFYIRDITGNILGLIDNEVNYIIKYTYNACGKVLEEICESCIASRIKYGKMAKDLQTATGYVF